jgi:hypothetical protein
MTKETEELKKEILKLKLNLEKSVSRIYEILDDNSKILRLKICDRCLECYQGTKYSLFCKKCKKPLNNQRRKRNG